MNIILFSPDEVQLPLPRTDARAVHLLTTLRREVDKPFDAGLLNGPRGKGTIIKATETHLMLAFQWDEIPPPALSPLHLIVGLPRPQTARDILRDATTLGVASIHFVRAEKSEPSYASSSLWSSGEWRRHVIAGAAQAFCTRLPEIITGQTLAETLATLPAGGARLLLDNYEATSSLADFSFSGFSQNSTVLALGSERGWSNPERTLFREHHFAIAHLGSRVLRVETAMVAAVTLVKSKRGWL